MTVCLFQISAADPVKIRIAQKYLLSNNLEDVAHIERIEKAMESKGIFIDIEIVDIPSSSYAEKLGLMLLSRDIPDLIYFQGGDQRFASQDILEDWRPWLKKTEYLNKALWPHNIIRLKNYPYLLYGFPPRTRSALIRQDWLAKSGLKPPQTVEQWTELLRVISESDFDGDGIKNTFGIITPNNTQDLDVLFNRAFGIASTWMKNVEGQWINAQVSDQERNKLMYYHRLFEQGLLDPEFITSNWEVTEDKFYTGRVGIVAPMAGINVDIYRTKLRQIDPLAELVILDPPAGVAQGLMAVDVSKETRGYAISTLSEHKEEVVALLDFIASPEGQMLDRMGFEGEHFIRDGDNYRITEKMGTWYPRFLMSQPTMWSPPVELLSPAAQDSLAQGMKYFVADNNIVFPSDYASKINAIENYYRTNVYRFVSGQMSFNDWEKYVKGWYAVGGNKLTEFYQESQNDSD